MLKAVTGAHGASSMLLMPNAVVMRARLPESKQTCEHTRKHAHHAHTTHTHIPLLHVNSLSRTRTQLAGHLCSKAVRDLLAGDDTFVRELKAKGFGRVQLNATAANNFDPKTVTDGTAETLHTIAQGFPEVWVGGWVVLWVHARVSS